MNSATLGSLSPNLTRGTEFVPHDCQKCPLASSRTQVVPAEGPARPHVFLVGEAPGPDEDRLGRPFIGRAGRILRTALSDIGWTDSDVWITNAVKCFPNERNGSEAKIRAPTPAEVAACSGHLAAETATLRPGLIVALGRTAASALLGGPVQLDAVHGTTAGSYHGVPVFVTFHPSGLHYKKGRAEEFKKDLATARKMVEARPE
jgi:uracil-DNA glycosylase